MIFILDIVHAELFSCCSCNVVKTSGIFRHTASPGLLGHSSFFLRLSYSIDVSLSHFKIWSTLVGYERLAMGLSQSEAEKNVE